MFLHNLLLRVLAWCCSFIGTLFFKLPETKVLLIFKKEQRFCILPLCDVTVAVLLAIKDKTMWFTFKFLDDV